MYFIQNKNKNLQIKQMSFVLLLIKRRYVYGTPGSYSVQSVLFDCMTNKDMIMKPLTADAS